MLLSMTGYGEARYQSDKLNLSIELRSLNNRHLKLIVLRPGALQPARARVRENRARRHPPGHSPVAPSLQVRPFHPGFPVQFGRHRKLREAAQRASGALAGPSAMQRCGHRPNASAAGSCRRTGYNGLCGRRGVAAFSRRWWSKPWPGCKKCAWKKARRWPKSSCSIDDKSLKP